MVEWGVSSKCHSAQAPVSLARVTSYNCNFNYNYNYNYSLARVTQGLPDVCINMVRCILLAKFSTSTKLCKIHLYSAKVNKRKSLTMCTWSKGSNGPMWIAQCKSIYSARLHIVQEYIQCKSDTQSGKVAGCTSKGCRPVSQCSAFSGEIKLEKRITG